MVGRAEGALRMRRGVELVQANRLRDAATLLNVPDSSWVDEEARADARRMRTQIRARIEVERALSLVRQNKLTEARAAFQRVLAMDVDDQTKAFARKSIGELDAATTRH